MGRKPSVMRSIQSLLSDGRPRTTRQIACELNCSLGAASQALRRAWESGVILRAAVPSNAIQKQSEEKHAVSKNVRGSHSYCISRGEKETTISGCKFVSFSRNYLDPRGGGSDSKAKFIREFLASNRDRAFYSTEVARSLKDVGVKAADVMGSVRRLEKQGLVYVRGYETGGRQIPFREGYIVTWLDSDKPRDIAIREAFQRTEAVLERKILKEQEVETRRQDKAAQAKPSVGGPRNLGKAGNHFFLYIPPDLALEESFPFRPGTPLSLEVKPDCLVIRADEAEKVRVPFLPPNSPTFWFKGTCNLQRNRTGARSRDRVF